MEEFKINEYIMLKLENGKSNIYIKGELFNHCKSLLLSIPRENLEVLEEIKSIDEISERIGFSLDISLERYMEEKQRDLVNKITPETEFLVHCSNLQVWAEHEYDTRLIHSNLAFPLLKKLTDVGDPIAQKKFKEEISVRYFSGIESVRGFLEEEGYLEYLSKEEIRSFIDSGVDVLDEIEQILDKEFYISTNSLGNSLSALIKNGKIIGLELSNLGLKEIPDCVQKLGHLEILDLVGNIIEEIPEWIGKLKTHKEINAVTNKIKRIPESIGQLTSLQFLNLSKSEIKELPNSIGNLKSLKELLLYSNKIKELPDTIGNLSNLEKIFLNKNQLNSLPDSIGNLINLQVLDLNFNPIIKLPISIIKLASLKSLKIARTGV